MSGFASVIGSVLSTILAMTFGFGVGLAALAGVMAIGIFSKESAAVLVAVMVIYDFTCRKFNWPAYVSVAIPLAFYTWARLHVLRGLYSAARPFTDNPLVGADFWAARLTAVKVVGRYLLLLIWPARLSCDYSYNEVPLAGWSDFGALLSLLACAGVASSRCRGSTRWTRPSGS